MVAEVNQTKEQVNASDGESDTNRTCKINNAKKLRLFSANAFRKSLKTDEKLNSLRQFLELCVANEEHDYTFEYLEAGGSCMELLNTLENSSDIPHALVLQIVTHLLLQIHTKHPHLHRSGHDTCKHLLSTHMTLFNKMLGLNSKEKERKTILKLLTVIVMYSPSLAKDILIHVNLNVSNLELLTKHTGGEDSVRNALIRFVTSFLVCGHYPTILAILEKHLLLMSIIKGLQFDVAESVCLVLGALKSHVLENPFFSKTVKMKMFNTLVIEDIVSLYNWKGPAGYDPKHKKKHFDVDEYAKSRVSEAVHSFLVVLCTSHKFGVVFKDHLFGLGRKTQNPLVYTVLQKLQSPWEHSYASDLIVKVCKACPDLVKTVWSNLRPSLEPRPTEKWLKAVRFMKNVLCELEPSCIQFSAKELSVHQLALITQTLLMPGQILKTVIHDTEISEKQAVMFHILQLLVDMLKLVETYVATSKTWLTVENARVYKNLLNDHVSNNFPSALSIVANWNDVPAIADDDSFDSCSVLDYLQVCLDLLELYQIHCPQLLIGLNNVVDISVLLQQIHDTPDKGSQQVLNNLQVKIVRFFLSLDHNLFLPQGELFTRTTPLIMDIYHNTKDPLAYGTLHALFESTGIFEGSEPEIDIWINSTFDLKRLDSSISELLIETVKLTYNKSVEYLTQLSTMKVKSSETGRKVDVSSVIETLIGEDQSYGGRIAIRHSNLSPLILGVLEYLSENQVSRSVKCFLNYAFLNLLHLQTNPDVLIGVFNRQHVTVCSENVLLYIMSWQKAETLSTTFLKTTGKLNLLPELGQAILTSDMESFITSNESNFTTHKEQIMSLLHLAMFYVTRFAAFNNLTSGHVQSCLDFLKYLLEKTDVKSTNMKHIIRSSLGHPIMAQFFSPLHLYKDDSYSFCTYFLKEFVKYLKGLNVENLDSHLTVFRLELYSSLCRIVRWLLKSKICKVHGVLELVEAFDLEFDQCYKLTSNISKLDVCFLNEERGPFIVKLFTYCLRRLCFFHGSNLHMWQPLEGGTIGEASALLGVLNLLVYADTCGEFAKVFKRYLDLFPHCIEYVDPILFKCICERADYCQENTNLAVLLLNKRPDFTETFVQHVDNVCTKKGLILPLLDVLVRKKSDTKVLQKIYDAFEFGIVKALQKPQKAGQHFDKHYRPVAALLSEFLPVDKCKSYAEKVQKYDSTAVFHAHLMEAVFDKAIFASANYDEKLLNNCLLTFVHMCTHLLKKKGKSDEDWRTLNGVAEVFVKFLHKIHADDATKSLSYVQVCNSEAFKTLYKLCLKFGISGCAGLLKLLRSMLVFLQIQGEDADLLMEMVFSHSQFLEEVLNEGGSCKTEIFFVIMELCERHEHVVKKAHVPVLLAAYGGTMTPCDRILLQLLKRYESLPARTYFYDFKPFLWGPAAANHYSVRSDVHKSLWRQPKMRDVLGILDEQVVLNTIKTHRLELDLNTAIVEVDGNASPLNRTYDLTFLLPLFSLLLSPESVVQTYKFTKSGALSLTILALSNEHEDVRAAACHVISRFYYHLEASRVGKDNTLWLRFVEAVCRGTSVLENHKMNNFAAMFLARMASILTNPLHAMYIPLSQYLGSKSTLDFSSIPELYTLLHPPEVNYKEHRNFILEVVRDGLRTDGDCDVALRSMCFKLIMELISSTVSDLDTKFLCLDVLCSASRLRYGLTLLCSRYGFLSWVHQVVTQLDVSHHSLLPALINLLYNTAQVIKTSANFNCSLIILTLSHVSDNISTYSFTPHTLKMLVRTVILIFERDADFLTEPRLKKLIGFAGSNECEFLLTYGSKYVDFDFNFDADEDERYYLKYLTLKWIMCNKK